MKKILSCLLLTAFILSWCGSVNNWWSENVNGEKTYKVLTSYKCNKSSINDCERWDWVKQWEIKSITFAWNELNNFTFSELSESNKEGIIKLDDDFEEENWELVFHWNQFTVSRNVESCQTFDISLDITYYDRHSWEDGELNKYIMSNRIQKLRNFLEWDNSWNLKIKEGDKINLRFIWTMKENDSQANLKDSVEFYYKKPCTSEEITYIVKEDDVEINNMRGEIDYFYILNKDSQKEADNKEVVDDMDVLIEKVSNEFYKRYGSMSIWTYLLDHFNESLSTYREWQTNIILSDFFFQLSDTDKKALKKKFCNRAGEYCADDIYQYSIENITSKYQDKYFFKNLFTKHIFEEFPSLNDLCPVSWKWEKMDVYLLWIDTIPWISVQDKVKDYYSNYLLKNCNVKYK